MKPCYAMILVHKFKSCHGTETLFYYFIYNGDNFFSHSKIL